MPGLGCGRIRGKAANQRNDRWPIANRQIKNAQARRARKKGAEIMNFGPEGKIWRQPTLAEPIEPLPSARLCLTAVFGMGTGRTTALWPPKRLLNEFNR